MVRTPFIASIPAMHRFAVVLVSVLVSAGCATAGLDEPAPDAAVHADARVVVSTPDASIPTQFPDAQLTIDAPVRIDAPLAMIDAPSSHPDAYPLSPDASLPIDARPHPDAFVSPTPDAFVPPIPDAFVPPPTPDAPTGGGCTTMELQEKGNFDSSSGAAGSRNIGRWQEDSEYELVYSASDLAGGTGLPSPQSGNYLAWIGDPDDPDEENLFQAVTVPAGTQSLTFSGYVNILTDDPTDSDDVLGAFIVEDPEGALDETLQQFDSSDETSDWQQFSFTATGSYSGRTIDILIGAVVTDEDTGFFVDTLSLQATVCP